MAKLPLNDQMNDLLNETPVVIENRSHVGLSEIGHKCHRYLQYVHYWAFDKVITNRVERLFNFGSREEEVMIGALEAQGYYIYADQKEIIGYSGHWKGHIDGLAYKDVSEPHELLECKTHNDKSFKDLCKRMVELSKPQHYAQMQAYMGYLELDSAIYIAENKNDSTLYFERVKFDQEYFEDLKRKEIEIVTSENLLPRIGNNTSTWFECKWCDAREVCFEQEKPAQNCRTCHYIDVLDGGQWECQKNGMRDEQEQRDGCPEYEAAEIYK